MHHQANLNMTTLMDEQCNGPLPSVLGLAWCIDPSNIYVNSFFSLSKYVFLNIEVGFPWCPKMIRFQHKQAPRPRPYLKVRSPATPAAYLYVMYMVPCCYMNHVLATIWTILHICCKITQSHLAILQKGWHWGRPHYTLVMVALAVDAGDVHGPFATWLNYICLVGDLYIYIMIVLVLLL